MTDEREHDQTVIQLGDIRPVLKSGVTCRAITALSMTDKPYMTLEEMAEICGFGPTTLVTNGFLGNLFHFEIVEPVPDEADGRKVKGYRLTEKARRSGHNAADAEIEELREKARISTRTNKKHKKITSGLSVMDGGAGEVVGSD